MDDPYYGAERCRGHRCGGLVYKKEKEKMKATLSPKNIRSLLPIYVDVADVKTANIQVSPSHNERSPLQPFMVEAVPQGSALRGTFWIEHPGDYEARVTSGTETITLPFHVAEQKFLNFSIEFGLFMAVLIVAAGGIILWHKKNQASLRNKN